MPGFTWRPAVGKPLGEYEKVAVAGGGASGRPEVKGASGSRAPGSASEPCPLGTVRVTVQRADNHKAVGGAMVTLSGLEPKKVDGSGKATFEKIAPAEYSVSVALADADINKYLPPPGCIVVLATSSTAEVTVEVEPLAIVKVMAKDEKTGKGLAGVKVALNPAAGGSALRAVSAKDGAATFTAVRGAAYTVSAEVDEALAFQYRSPLPVSGVEVKAGETKSLDLLIPPLGVQAIKVVKSPPADQSGKKAASRPFGGLPVRLKPAKGDELAAVTDSKTGIARFEAVRPGNYTVELDLGPDVGHYQAYQPITLDVKAPDNPERTIELVLLTCQLKQITVKEIIGKQGAMGLKDEPGRTFLLKKGGGGSGIGLKDGEPLQLVAPRKGDLFKKEPASLTPLPFNPPAGAFNDGVMPTWLEVDLDGVSHVVPPGTEATHPALVVQTGGGNKVVDAKGVLKSGRFLIWGPDFPWNLNPPQGSTRWLKKLGYTMAELFNGITKRAVAPSYWDLYTDHCDDDGAPVQSKTTLAVFPGDRYKLKLNIPAIKGFSYGVNGDYVKGEAITKSSGTSGLIGDSTSHKETTSASGTETVFASLFEGEYGAEPMVSFSRNGQSHPLVSDLVTAVLFSATEAVKWFSELGNLQPQWGFWVSADISLLKVSIEAEWGWMSKPKVNDINWLYQIKLSGTLVEVKVGIRAGVEGTVVPSLVYFRAVIYLEVGGKADAEWTWVSDKRPTEQKASTTASLELGVDLVIGNANFCQAKSWVKAPYTLQWNILAPDPDAKRDKWDVNFKHGCKDGIYFVALYKLFYGKYSGTKKIELKEPVDLD